MAMEPSEEECRMRDLFHKTAAEGDLERLIKMAEAADENIQLGLKRTFEILRHFDGRTALHSAAEADQINVCQYLIEVVKLDVNIKDNDGFPPLFRAIQRRNLRTTTYLIDHGANVMLANRSGCTALHCAVETGSLEGSRSEEFMRLLISKGAVIDAKSVNGTPLELAIQAGMNKTVEILLEHKADPNLFVQRFTPLILSVIGYKSEYMDLLLKAGADQNMVSFGCTPLAAAAFVGNTVAIKRLLEAGANANAISMYGTTAVEDALLTKHYDKVKIFFPRTSCHSDILKRTTGGMRKHIFLEKALPQYGVALLETAALRNLDDEVVGILFPRTSPIPGIQEWTIDGIRKHVCSEEALRQRKLKWNEYLSFSKSKGKDCFEKDDYKMAIYWYTEAISADPSDIEVLLSSRSLCYARLNEGGLAYIDAARCLSLNPDWAEAYSRLAMALKLLEEYAASAFAFKKALELNPEDAEVQTANREIAAWGLNESDM